MLPLRGLPWDQTDVNGDRALSRSIRADVGEGRALSRLDRGKTDRRRIKRKQEP